MHINKENRKWQKVNKKGMQEIIGGVLTSNYALVHQNGSLVAWKIHTVDVVVV